MKKYIISGLLLLLLAPVVVFVIRRESSTIPDQSPVVTVVPVIQAVQTPIEKTPEIKKQVVDTPKDNSAEISKLLQKRESLIEELNNDDDKNTEVKNQVEILQAQESQELQNNMNMFLGSRDTKTLDLYNDLTRQKFQTEIANVGSSGTLIDRPFIEKMLLDVNKKIDELTK